MTILMLIFWNISVAYMKNLSTLASLAYVKSHSTLWPLLYHYTIGYLWGVFTIRHQNKTTI